MKYKYFQVNQKLGAPVMSQPAPAIRKSSAGSTQSDSRLVVGKKTGSDNDINTSKLGQKNALLKDLLYPDDIEETSSKKPFRATKKSASLSAFSPIMPKDGSDRQINRNITMNENVKNSLLDPMKR